MNTPSTHLHTIHSIHDLSEFSKSFCSHLQLGDIVLLEGPMGAGKTTFVKECAAYFGIDSDEVTSPTFALVHEYLEGRFPILHLDLYRLNSDQEIQALGIFERFDLRDAIVFIEWASKLPSESVENPIRVQISFSGEDRIIRVTSSNVI